HQRKLMKSNYSVKKLIEQSLESLPIYKYPDIVISLKIQNYLRDFEIDVNLMKQAIKNLIMNSIEASNGFGRIEIRAYMKRELLIIEIQDWGCGMDEETKRQIFNPFFTTKTSGTGLGLSIVHRVIDQHQGKIEVESYPSRGTMFRIIL
ncbi:MAG: PAS domain-containing sensor histidine kinase, partial [Spirochaetes bacterium]